jgi:hypothetical protein
MWNHAGSTDETRVSKDDVAEDEVKKMVRRLTTLTTADEVPIACQAEHFNKDHPLPPVCFVDFIFNFFLLLVSSFFICSLYLPGPSLPSFSPASA